MTKKDIADLLKRVTGMYPTFVPDGAIFDEWHGGLKDYRKDNVIEGLEQWRASGKVFAPSLPELLKNIGGSDDMATYRRMLTRCQSSDDGHRRTYQRPVKIGDRWEIRTYTGASQTVIEAEEVSMRERGYEKIITKVPGGCAGYSYRRVGRY